MLEAGGSSRPLVDVCQTADGLNNGSRQMAQTYPATALEAHQQPDLEHPCTL